MVLELARRLQLLICRRAAAMVPRRRWRFVIMFKRVMLAALLSMSISTLALADSGSPAATSAAANQTKTKVKPKAAQRVHKNQSGHQGRKGARSNRRGMKRSAKGAQQAR
jgi:hypothetical protein